MPVNYQQLRSQVNEMGKSAPRLQRERLDRLQRALQALNENAHELDALRQRVAQAAALNEKLRCALPTDEALTLAHDAPVLPPGVTLLAADGSQINPSAHDAVPFGVINVAVFEMHPGAGSTPLQHVETRLLVQEEVFTDYGLIGEEVIALRRDQREREMLLRLAAGREMPVITLTDGPLELFRPPAERALYQAELDKYKAVLEQMAEEGVVAAGFVEKSRADLVVRLLELALLPDEQLATAGVQHPLKTITDIDLFRGLLGRGQRSAVFGIQTSGESHFEGRLAVHFFYLNISNSARPYLARVEVPAWVAQRAPLLNTLQAALLWQCRQMGPNASPYALHRAHEIAVVRLEERQEVENMILAELRRLDLETDEKSHKQANKELPGKRKRP